MAVLLVLALALGVASLAGADESPPDANSHVVSEPEGASEQLPVAFPDLPLGKVWTVNGELITVQDLGEPANSEPAAPGRTLAQTGGARLYYVTSTNFASDVALTACASSYHMASMWEILDPSNLVYDFSHPDAKTLADSGHGPPSDWYGRVRTGFNSSGSATVGSGNCNNWTSTSSTVDGNFVRLTRTWETPPAEVGGVWDTTDFTCATTGPVWCVEDAIDLDASGSALPSPVRLANDLTYNLALGNQGPQQATSVQVSGTLTGNAKVTQASPTQGSCILGSGTFNCDLGVLADNAQANVSLTVVPLSTGTLTNTVTVSGLGYDVQPGDNTVAIVTAVANQSLFLPVIRR